MTRGLEFPNTPPTGSKTLKWTAILGTLDRFGTGDLTPEFKNNLDALIDEIDDSNSQKSFRQIDFCVCWSVVGDNFKGYAIELIAEINLDERRYPGVTHLLRRDGEGHFIQIIMLERVIGMIQSGSIEL